MNRKRAPWAGRSVLTLLFAAVMLWFVVANKDYVFDHLGSLSAGGLTLLLGATLIYLLLNALRLRHQLRAFGLHLPAAEWVGLTFSNSLLSYALPLQGGLVARAVFLKYRHGFSYTHHASLLAGAALLSLAVSAAFGLLCTALLPPPHGETRLFFMVLFGFLLAATAAAMAVFALAERTIRLTGWTRLADMAGTFAVAAGVFRKEKSETALFSLCHVLAHLALGLRLIIAFKLIGYTVSPVPALVVLSLTSFLMIFSLTPGNLGVREGVVVLSASLLGVSAEAAALAAIVDRAAIMTVLLPLGLVSGHYLLKELPPPGEKGVPEDPRRGGTGGD